MGGAISFIRQTEQSSPAREKPLCSPAGLSCQNSECSKTALIKGQHGGDVYRNKVRLDFSVSLNPLGMPESVKEAAKRGVDLSGQYPDWRQDALREKISNHFQVPPHCILPGNGAAELIYAFCQALRPKRGLCFVPCFQEYEEALLSAGAVFCPVFLPEEEAFQFPPQDRLEFWMDELVRKNNLGMGDVVFLCNPNNPTGVALSAESIHIIARCLEKKKIWLFLDECFLPFLDSGYSFLDLPYMDKHERASLSCFICAAGASQMGLNACGIKSMHERANPSPFICAAGASQMGLNACGIKSKNDNEEAGSKSFAGRVFLLRAFTKIYAMPGLRLGFGICFDMDLYSKMRSVLQPWNISLPAQLAGIAALDEEKYVRVTRGLVRQEHSFLSEKLSQGLAEKTYPGNANFILFKARSDLSARLLEKGILIRDCRNFRGLSAGFFRIAVRTHEENIQLIRAFEESLSR